MRTTTKKSGGNGTPRQRTECLMRELEEGVRNVYTSENWTRYLAVQSRFHHYSYSNSILIMCQMPTATRVAGFARWRELGRSVRKGEHGIRILAPMTRKEETGKEDPDGVTEGETARRTFFAPVTVFDVSQTEGEELPDICRTLTGDVDGFERLREAVEAAADCPVSYEDGTDASHGYYDTAADRIVVKAGEPQAQTVKTLLHEVAHSILHRRGGPAENAPRDVKEVQAESTAYVVCKHFGVDTDGYTFEYVASWGRSDLKELRENLSLIQKTAETLIDRIEERLRGSGCTDGEEACA